MRPNYICCIGTDRIGRAACCIVAYKCPEIRVTVLDEKESLERQPSFLSCYEPDLEQIIKKCRNRNLFFTSDYVTAIKDADLIFLCISVPVVTACGIEGKTLDFKELEDVARRIAIHSESDKIIVEKTNVSARAAKKISDTLKVYCRTGIQYKILSNPEFITGEFDIKDLLKPERVVIGCQNNPPGRSAAESLCELYERWVPRKDIIIINHWSSEIFKLAANAFPAQKLCSVNSFAIICEQSGADYTELSNILCRDCRLGSKYFNASLGFGGFQKDILNFISLCKSLKLQEIADYWQAVLDLNNYFIQRFIEKIQSILGSVEGKEITILGFSYKKSTYDTKYSPAIEVSKWLLKEKCNLKIHDPYVEPRKILNDLELSDSDDQAKNVQIITDVYLACSGSSAIIICTDRDEFIQLDYLRLVKWMKTPIVIDGRKCLNGKALKDFGVEYHTIGLTSSL